MFLSYDTIEAFALKRNPVLSFPYLKENGELLAIAANSGFLIEPRALDLYADFYRNALKFTECYPQYFRFTLGMVNDLEKGGMRGNESQKIAKFVRDENYLMFDTSDSRKLETLTMLREVSPLSKDYRKTYDDIVDSVEQLISNPDWYTKFNKPLFYELTHIIFFLTNYGTVPLPLKNEVDPCLSHMGILALLDNDADLLAEICTCFIFMGVEVPPYWNSFLEDNVQDIKITYDGTVASSLNSAVDEYHVYFVLNWYQALQDRPTFETRFNGRTPSFSIPPAPESLLSQLSSYAHNHHFNQTTGSESLELFLSNLKKDELEHWSSIIDSSELSRSLVQKLSGLSLNL